MSAASEEKADGGGQMKQPVDRACLPCRMSHLACDSSRPCKRCTSSGKAAQCVDPERRKRGRPRKSKAADEGELASNASAHGSIQQPPQHQHQHLQPLPQPQLQRPQPVQYQAHPPQVQAPPPQHRAYPQPVMPTNAGLPSVSSSSSSSSIPQPSASHTPSNSSQSAPFPPNIPHPHQQAANASPFSPTGFLAQLGGNNNTTFPPSPQSFPFPFPPFPFQGAGPHSPPPFPPPFPPGTNSLPFPPFPLQSKPSEQSSSASSESTHSSARAEARSEVNGHRRRGYSSPTESYSSSPPDSPQAPAPAPGGSDIEGLLSILVGQVRDLKDSIKGVQKELKAVNKRQKTFEDHHKQLKERVELLIPLIANQAAPTMPRTRAEILEYFPLLKAYESLYSPDTPFVIDEFTKPIAIVLFVTPLDAIAHKFMPPIYIYANDAFCNLLRYPLSEILACPVTKFSMPSEDNRAEIMATFANAQPNGFSPVMKFSPYAIKRDGTVIKMHSRHQMFFNEAGHPKWAVMVVDSVSDENVYVEVRRVALQSMLNQISSMRSASTMPSSFPAHLPGFPFPFPFPPCGGPDASSALMPASPLRHPLPMATAFSAAAAAAAATGKRKRSVSGHDDDLAQHIEGVGTSENTTLPAEDCGFVPSTPPALFQLQGFYSPLMVSSSEGDYPHLHQHHNQHHQQQDLHNATAPGSGGRRTEDTERAELRELLAGILSSPMPSPIPSSLSFPSGGHGSEADLQSTLFYTNMSSNLITPASPPPASPMYSSIMQALRDRRDFP